MNSLDGLKLLCTVAMIGVSACSDVNVESPTRASDTSNSNNSAMSKIEFRVTGNATSVRIRSSDSNNGLSQVITTLPYTNTFTTSNDSLFLSLDATPINYSALTVFPFLSVQIFVNGILFREATSNEFLLNTLSVNGTWRK